MDLLSFPCPRCRLPVDERFYGPCTNCRDALGVTVGREARLASSTAYEPKMNVTPNAIATRE